MVHFHSILLARGSCKGGWGHRLILWVLSRREVLGRSPPRPILLRGGHMILCHSHPLREFAAHMTGEARCGAGGRCTWSWAWGNCLRDSLHAGPSPALIAVTSPLGGAPQQLLVSPTSRGIPVGGTLSWLSSAPQGAGGTCGVGEGRVAQQAVGSVPLTAAPSACPAGCGSPERPVPRPGPAAAWGL